MKAPKSWEKMNVDEKLEMLRHEMGVQSRQAAAIAKSFDELRRRTDEIERRFEEMPFN